METLRKGVKSSFDFCLWNCYKATMTDYLGGINNIPRDLAIYLIRNHSMSKLEEIAEIFHFNNYSGVSTAIERVKKQIESDPISANKVKTFEDQLNKKSQKKI